MANWDYAIRIVKHITFKVYVGDFDGTGCIVGTTGNTIMVATAWHLVEDLFQCEDKFSRYIELESAVGDMVIKANAVGVARFGSIENDIGIVWVGPVFSSEGIDKILQGWAKSKITDGALDLSGGGGIIEVTGNRKPTTDNTTYNFLSRNQVSAGMDVAWLGYPSVASDALCLFRGVISATSLDTQMYLVDGTVIPGLSGGPVFDVKGNIIGIVSKYLGDQDTSSGLIEIAPVSELKTTL